jgi:hypothetical protein
LFVGLKHLCETGALLVTVSEHAEGDCLPFGMDGFGVVEFGLACVKFLDFSQQFFFGFDFLKVLVARQHLVQD